MFKPIIESRFTVDCCHDYSGAVYSYKHAALAWLLQHIETAHPKEFIKLTERGREMARRRNGCGYYDSDHINGWAKATGMFREAWTTQALEQLIGVY